MEDAEGQEHGKGDGNTHQNGVAHTQEKKEDRDHQDQTAYDIVLQVRHHDSDVLGLIHELGDGGPCRPGLFPLPDEPVDLVGDTQDVLPGPLLDLNVHCLSAVQACPARFVLEAVHDPGHVLEVDRSSIMECHDQAVDLIRAGELAGHPELKSAVCHTNGTARHISVFRCDDPLQLCNGETVVGKFVRKGLYPDFPLQSARDIHPQNAGYGLDVLLQVLGHLFESDKPYIAGHGIDHDGHLRDVHLKDLRIIFQIRRQFYLGKIHLVLGLLEYIVDVCACHELDDDGAVSFGAGGLDFLDGLQALEFFLDGNGNGLFDIFRGNTGIIGLDEDKGNGDIRGRLPGKQIVGNHPEEEDHNGQEDHTRPFSNCCFRYNHDLNMSVGLVTFLMISRGCPWSRKRWPTTMTLSPDFRPDVTWTSQPDSTPRWTFLFSARPWLST